VLTLLGHELEHEVLGEPPGVALGGFVEPPSGDAVNSGQIAIGDHAMATQDEDRLGDVLDGLDGAGEFPAIETRQPHAG
jgi:hypothetical protein